MNPVLSEKQLGTKFDAAIKALESNDGDALVDLAGLIHYVALTTDEPAYFLVSDVLGELGFHFNIFYPIQSTPFPLGKEQLPHFQGLYRVAKEECVKGLRELRAELCEKDNPDHKSLVRTLGVLLKYSHTLRAKRDSLLRSQPPFPGLRPMEE